MRKKNITMILFFLIIAGLMIIPLHYTLAENTDINITFETSQDGTIYANDVPVARELNLTKDDLTKLVDIYLNDPQNLPKLSDDLHNLLAAISLTLEEAATPQIGETN